MSDLKKEYDQMFDCVYTDLKTVTENIMLEMKLKMLLEAVEQVRDGLRELQFDLSLMNNTAEQKEGATCREVAKSLMILEQVLIKVEGK